MTENTVNLPEYATRSIKQHELTMERINAGVVPDGMSGTAYEHQDAISAIEQEFKVVDTGIEETA